MEFHVVATDCATGKAVYRRLDKADARAFDWIRASASMPLVSRPVEIDGGLYLDGGLSDGIPLRYFESIGYERNVVITTRPHGYRKFPTRKIRLVKPLLRRYPAVYKALVTRHVWYNEALEYIDSRVAAGAAVLIAPKEPLEISRVCHDPDMMQRVYDIGREAGESALTRVNVPGRCGPIAVLAMVLAMLAGCVSPCGNSPFAKYDDAKKVEIVELKRTAQSWDGAELPNYPAGRPELIVRRYIFPRGSRLGWHHHPVMNYGIVQQGELTIIVEMVGTIHHGENRGDKTVVLDMFYISQPGTEIAVQHPEITK